MIIPVFKKYLDTHIEVKISQALGIFLDPTTLQVFRKYSVFVKTFLMLGEVLH